MKYIELLGPISAVNIVNGEPMKDPKGDDLVITGADFIRERLCDLKFSMSMKGVLAAVKILKALDAMVDNILALEDADHAILKDVVENPSPQMPYDPRFAPSLAPHMQAVVDDAKSELPEAAE